MEFLYKDLGILSGGTTVEVTLRNAANIRLMDEVNFRAFRNNGSHRAVAHYVKQSPYLVTVPNAGHWYIVLDLGGASGRIEYSIRLLPR